MVNLMDVSDIFYFFCSGKGKGSPSARREGRGRFFIEHPRRGGLPGEGAGAEGLEGVWRDFGGEEGYFFFWGGRNSCQASRKELTGEELRT